jgi:hypothetical protein
MYFAGIYAILPYIFWFFLKKWVKMLIQNDLTRPSKRSSLYLYLSHLLVIIHDNQIFRYIRAKHPLLWSILLWTELICSFFYPNFFHLLLKKTWKKMVQNLILYPILALMLDDTWVPINNYYIYMYCKSISLYQRQLLPKFNHWYPSTKHQWFFQQPFY